jgi:hypothetical protein
VSIIVLLCKDVFTLRQRERRMIPLSTVFSTNTTTKFSEIVRDAIPKYNHSCDHRRIWYFEYRQNMSADCWLIELSLANIRFHDIFARSIHKIVVGPNGIMVYLLIKKSEMESFWPWSMSTCK